jgi:citrate synthase
MADTLSVTDNRTGKSYELPIKDGAITAMDLRAIKVHDDDFGMLSYDPAYKNTASCRSDITFIDGEKGILQYRGYPIEQLAEKSTFLETAYLVLNGELPAQKELDKWVEDVSHHTFVHEKIKRVLDGLQDTAHPMGVLVSVLGALSTFYPEAREVRDEKLRSQQVLRLVAKIPTIAAYAYRKGKGLPYVQPDTSLSYTENFLSMLFRMSEVEYKPNPVLVKALEQLFILHIDHEQNCSASAMRAVGSSEVDPFCAAAASCAALYGPLHGGANERVLRMLDEIGDVKNIPEFIEGVKSRKYKLMGFGHRVYKNYDPRARIIKNTAAEVFEVTGSNPKIEIAKELERIALSDEFFASRKLYPNVDFYSGIIYEAMGFPTDFFTVLFAVPRMVGWLAQWTEMLNDKEQKIARPRQLYMGHRDRSYVSMEER